MLSSRLRLPSASPEPKVLPLASKEPLVDAKMFRLTPVPPRPHPMLPFTQFEIDAQHDLTIVGSLDGTSMHVLPEVDGPSFIVNRGRLRIARIHFKGPGTRYSVEGVPGVAWDERGMRALENHDDLVVSWSR